MTTIGHHDYPLLRYLPQTDDCAGSEHAALFGCGLLSSYLLLFIQFFINTYVIKKKPAKGAAKGNGKPVANGVANGANKRANGTAEVPDFAS